MNQEPGQIFWVENYRNIMLIGTAFGTVERIPKGEVHPYQFYESMRKLKYRLFGMFIYSQKKHIS